MLDGTSELENPGNTIVSSLLHPIEIVMEMSGRATSSPRVGLSSVWRVLNLKDKVTVIITEPHPSNPAMRSPPRRINIHQECYVPQKSRRQLRQL